MVQVIDDSQFFTSLEMILNFLHYEHTRQPHGLSEFIIVESKEKTKEELVKYLEIAVQNTINQGYSLIKTQDPIW